MVLPVEQRIKGGSFFFLGALLKRGFDFVQCIFIIHVGQEGQDLRVVLTVSFVDQVVAVLIDGRDQRRQRRPFRARTGCFPWE